MKALVTGAASGIGLATATMLARAGAKVAINHLPDDPRGAAAIETLRGDGLDVLAAPGKVGAPGETERMVETAVSNLGGLDLLVNNAGTPGVPRPVPMPRLDLVTDELWAKILETNLLGVFRCSKTAAPALKASRGSIVNTASIAGFDSAGSSIVYGASKAGVVSLTKNLARALAPEVRVNGIAPGAVDSSWIEWPEGHLRDRVEHTLLKRISAPEDLAEVIVFLAFGNSMITGQTIIVDGGLTLR
jgi:3-oxoacyl-[acyl-carrier protein] reductase